MIKTENKFKKHSSPKNLKFCRSSTTLYNPSSTAAVVTVVIGVTIATEVVLISLVLQSALTTEKPVAVVIEPATAHGVGVGLPHDPILATHVCVTVDGC